MEVRLRAEVIATSVRLVFCKERCFSLAQWFVRAVTPVLVRLQQPLRSMLVRLAHWAARALKMASVMFVRAKFTQTTC